MLGIRTNPFRAAAAALVVAATAAIAAPVPTAEAVPLDTEQVSDVAEQVVESVVNVSTTKAVAAGPATFDPFFSDPRSPFYRSPDDLKQRSAGSGVIVTAEGRILTNAHVVEGADEIIVTLSDGTELDAEIIGIDPPSDLAVLQLQGDVPPLRPLPLGDSSKLRLGEVVLAVGNPFGAGQAVSLGIVSAKGRAGFGLVDYEDFVQTDAAINPGNSGGALVNLRGELVGINTAILSRTGGYDGIGFAIPSNMAAPIMKMLVEDGKVSRGYIGVMLAPLTRDWLKEHAVATKRGVLVKEIVDGGPAAKAGLAVDDVIVGVDGTPVETLAQLRNHIAMRGAGATVELEVVRGKRSERVQVTTAELPQPTAQAPAKRAPANEKSRRGR